MCLSVLKVECKNDFIISKLSGEEMIALESGNTYDAVDTGTVITVSNGQHSLSFLKSEFPTSILGVVN